MTVTDTVRASQGLPEGNLLLNHIGGAEALGERSSLTLVDMRRGEVLCEAGEPVRYVHLPLRGLISMVVTMEEGDSAEVNMIGREGAHGMGAILADRPSLAQATCQMDGPVYRIDARDFREAVEASPALRAAVDAFEYALLANAQQNAACNLLHGLERRLARWILTCLTRAESNELFLTQEFLGQMLGVRRTTVTEVAQSLQARGLIRYSRGKITVIDRDGMEDAACECCELMRARLYNLWR